MKTDATRSDEQRDAGAARLAISFPIGRRFAWGLVWLITLAGLAEAIVRMPAVARRLPAPSYGAANRQFELQLARLRAFVTQHGQPDCLFVGNSQVLRGINPLEFADGYHTVTGVELHCFSFGLRGMDPSVSYDVVRVLLQEVSPAVLIVGTDIPSYSTSRAEGIRGGRLGTMDWLRYRLGDANAYGWLIDHLAAVRAYLPFRFWFLPDFARQQAEAERFDTQVTLEGFGHLNQVSDLVGGPPTVDDPQVDFFDILREYELDPKQLTALDGLLTLREQTGVIIVEMPLHPTFLTFFGNGVADFDRGLEAVRAHIAPTGVELVETTKLDFIPDEGWASRNHLNQVGAAVLSRWLGEELARRALAGRIPALAALGVKRATP